MPFGKLGPQLLFETLCTKYQSLTNGVDFCAVLSSFQFSILCCFDYSFIHASKTVLCLQYTNCLAQNPFLLKRKKLLEKEKWLYPGLSGYYVTSVNLLSQQNAVSFHKLVLSHIVVVLPAPSRSQLLFGTTCSGTTIYISIVLLEA